MLTNLKLRALLFLANLKGWLCYGHDPDQKIYTDVPYFSQWESPQLAGDILAKKISAQADPRWQQSGALTPDEYARWSWSGCGMACFKMLLAHQKHMVVPLVTLAKQCLQYGGYREPLEQSPGLFYKPFCRFVEQEYALHARTVSALTLGEITHAIAQGGYVLASVTYEIRYPDLKPERRGGHLILIIGYDHKKRLLYFHNPSGTSVSSQQNVALSFEQFNRFFANKGIIITT